MTYSGSPRCGLDSSGVIMLSNRVAPFSRKEIRTVDPPALTKAEVLPDYATARTRTGKFRVASWLSQSPPEGNTLAAGCFELQGLKLAL
jgi:hypothetical protein